MPSNHRSSLMTSVVLLLFIVLGTLQMVAIAQALYLRAGWSLPLAWGAGYVLGYVPGIGSIAGAVGAYYAWHWHPVLGVAVFVIPLLLLAIALRAEIRASVRRRMRR